jgi:hypothetical protein
LVLASPPGFVPARVEREREAACLQTVVVADDRASAAEAGGNRQMARTLYAKLLQIAKAADQPGRPELTEARKAIR